MSYALLLGDESRLARHRLDVWLQERALDELDELADHPETLPPRGFPSLVHDVVVEREGFRHYVFLVLEVGHVARQLIVAEIKYFAKPLRVS
jgi:hypothetical protein